MVKKTEEIKDINEEKKDIFKTWADSYTAVSKIWEDSYSKLYKPWLETTGEQFEKLVELSKDAAAEKYKEFYDAWVKTYQNSSSKFSQIPTLESNKETFEKLLISADESNKIYRSWIESMMKLSAKSAELSRGDARPEAYKEFYNLWVKTYEKAFDNFLENTPTISPFKEIIEPAKNAAKLYADTFTSISKIWMGSFSSSASSV